MDTIQARTDCLPPIGDIQPGSDDEAKAVELIYSRRQGIITSLATPLRLAKSCRKIIAWGEDTDVPDETKTVVHKIRQAVETQVANHLKEPVKITFEPVETGEYAKWYWSGPPEAANDLMMMGVPFDPLFLGAVTPMGQFIPPQSLPAQLVMQIKQLADVYPDVVSPDYICKLDDQYVAKTIQKKFDSDWREASGDKWLRSRVFANVVEGWQLPFYEYDSKSGHVLNRNSIFQTYIDQAAEDIDQAAEAGIDLYMDLNEALAKYPDQRDAILADTTVTSGQLFPPQTAGQVPTSYSGTFRRPMVRKVVWWVRNMPVGVQAAIDAGLVEERLVVDGQTGFAQQSAPVAPEDQSGDLAQQGQPGAIDAGNGAMAAFTGAPSQPSRSGFFLPNTDTEITPDSPDWPVAIGQMSIIANSVVEWIICPFPDIPLVHLRNTLIIGKPWGIGEPFYAKKIQDAYSNITDSAVKHTEYNANPAMEMHAALKSAMEAEYGRAFVDPSTLLGIPAELWGDGKTPLVRPILPPPFPESSLKIRALLSEDFNEIAGRPDVLAGETPTANASGELVAQLQSAAVEPLNFKAQEIAFAVEKLAGLMLHAILNYQDHAGIAEQLSMPLPLLRLVLDRAGKRPPSVQITISTGAGSVLERKRAQVVQWNQLVSPDDGYPLSDGKTTRDLIGVDSAMSLRRSIQARREAMASMPMTGADQQQGNGQQGKGNPEHSSNGNGNGHAGNGRGRMSGE